MEKAYQSTYRETDEHILLAALGSMQLRLAVKEATLSFDSAEFFNATHGKIWAAAKTLSEQNKMLFLDNLRPLLTSVELRVLEPLYGKPVRPVEFEKALHLVGQAARKRRMHDALRSVTSRMMLEDEYAPVLAVAHEALAGLENAEVSQDAVTLRETIEEFWEQVENPLEKVPKMSTPWPSLDMPFLRGGVAHGQLITIMAPSGGGKSVAALQLAGHWARENKKVAIFSLEMDRTDVTNRILASQSNTKIYSVSERQLDQDDEERLAELTDVLAGANVHIFDATNMTMPEIRQRCSVLQRTQGLDAVIIDYIQIVSPELADRSASREQQVAEIARQMKLLAMSGVAVITASQMNQMSDRPTKDSARESKAIIHHSDLVLALYHDPDKPGEVDMCVVKNRRGAETPHHGGLMMWWKADKSSIVDPTS